jgi:hypothetical protein
VQFHSTPCYHRYLTSHPAYSGLALLAKESPPRHFDVLIGEPSQGRLCGLAGHQNQGRLHGTAHDLNSARLHRACRKMHGTEAGSKRHNHNSRGKVVGAAGQMMNTRLTAARFVPKVPITKDIPGKRRGEERRGEEEGGKPAGLVHLLLYGGTHRGSYQNSQSLSAPLLFLTDTTLSPSTNMIMTSRHGPSLQPTV